MSINLKQAGLTIEETQIIIDALRVAAGLDDNWAEPDERDSALELLNKITGGDNS